MKKRFPDIEIDVPVPLYEPSLRVRMNAKPRKCTVKVKLYRIAFPSRKLDVYD